MQKRSFLPYIYEEHFRELPKKFPIIFQETELRKTPVSYLHAHNFLEIGLCLEGSGVFIFGDEMEMFSKGDVTVFPNGIFHQANSDSQIKSRWFFVFFNPSELLATCCDNPELLSVSNMKRPKFQFIFRAQKYPDISSLVKKLVVINNDKKAWFEMEIKSVLVQLLIQINRNTNPDYNVKDLKEGNNSIMRIVPALNYIAENYTTPIKIKKLADLCFVSVETLRRLFKKSIGKSPEGYIQNLRINMAASLIKNCDDPIYDIAMRSGFRTLSCFNRQFRKIMLMSPRDWQKK